LDDGLQVVAGRPSLILYLVSEFVSYTLELREETPEKERAVLTQVVFEVGRRASSFKVCCRPSITYTLLGFRVVSYTLKLREETGL